MPTGTSSRKLQCEISGLEPNVQNERALRMEPGVSSLAALLDHAHPANADHAVRMSCGVRAVALPAGMMACDLHLNAGFGA